MDKEDLMEYVKNNLIKKDGSLNQAAFRWGKFDKIKEDLYKFEDRGESDNENIYLFYFDKNPCVCSNPNCLNKTNFLRFKAGYSSYCSNECAQSHDKVNKKRKETKLKRYGDGNYVNKEKTKKTNLEKYGVESHNSSEKIKEKKKKTYIERYGVDNPLKSEEIKQKVKQTNLEKYGVEIPLQSEEIKEKIKETKLERYGNEYYNNREKEKNTKKIRYGDEHYNNKEKYRETCIKKYGINNTLGLKEIREKIVQTWKINYGVDYPLKSEEIKQKVKQTNLERYGVESVFQSEEIKEKTIKTSLDRYGTKYPLQNEKIACKIKNTKREQFYNKLLNQDRLENKVIPLFKEEEYVGILKKYKWKCVECHIEFEDHLDDGRIPRCPKCYPINKSKYELDLYNFILSLSVYVLQNTRQIILPLELDIYLPDYKLAIEFNGLYWHSTEYKDKNYHQNKVKLCNDKGIRLLHIWEDDWINDPDTEKEKILYYINNLKEEIKPRKPILEERMGFKIWT